MFPQLSAYLARLPAGLSSYPRCQAKGTLLRSSLEGHPVHPSWANLPSAIRSVMAEPPLPIVWVSTALTDAVFCAIADTYYPGEEAVERWTYERTLKQANSAMYRALTRLAGLRNFLRGAVEVHRLFQRGTDLEMDLRAGGATLRLVHPPHLHGRLNHLSNRGAFRAALESAGAFDVQIDLTASLPEGAVYEVRFGD